MHAQQSIYRKNFSLIIAFLIFNIRHFYRRPFYFLWPDHQLCGERIFLKKNRCAGADHETL